MVNEKLIKSYACLHCHSSLSLADGAQECKDMVARALEIKSPGIAISDHGNMSNFLKFHNECEKNGVNPIIGIEAYVNDSRNITEEIEENEAKNPDDVKNSHIILYAKNWNGVKNLFKISGEAFENGYYYKPRTTNDFIIKNGDDIIVTTACMSSQFSRLILSKKYSECEKLMKRYKDRFGSDFYGEVQVNSLIQQKIINYEIERLCDKLDIKIVFALDAHYALKEDATLQTIKMLLLQNKTFADLTNSSANKKPWTLDCDDLFIKSSQDIWDAIKQYNYNITKDQLNKWLDNANEINDKVNIDIPKDEQHFPKFDLPTGFDDAYKYFAKLCKDGLKNLYLNHMLDPEIPLENYVEQLKKEIEVLHKLKYIDYILVIKQTIDEVIKLGGRLGNGRGSCCGSLANYCLGITKVDPIKWGLTFERWANLERKDAPDIDVDIDSDTKQLIEARLEELYGKTSIAHIPIFGRYTPKVIIKDLCRVFGYEYTKSNLLTKEFDKYIPDEDEEESSGIDLNKLWEYVRDNTKNKDIVDFMDEIEDTILKWGPKLLGQVRQLGQHASGIIVADGQVSQYIPMQYVKGSVKAGLQDGGSDREISKMGLLKLDLLGLTNVSVIQDTVKLIKETKGTDADEEFYNNMDFDDPNVYERFQAGDTIDIFQFGSDGMRALLKDSKPTNLIDITACNALFRPAPLTAGVVKEYINARQNPESVKYIHPILETILGETSGQVVFQEQLIQILKELGGFTLGEADLVRKDLKMLSGDRAQQKSRKQDNFRKFQIKLNRFKKGAIDNGLTEQQTENLVNVMVKYAEYSFTKNHAFPYALNAYHNMWFKVYYPTEYYCSLLNRESLDKVGQLIATIRNHGIQIEYPSLLHLDNKFTVVDNKIYGGVGFIKGVGTDQVNILKGILSEMKLDDAPDIVLSTLLYKCIENKITKKTMEPLILLGLFDDIANGFNMAMIYELYNQAKKLSKKKLTLDNVIELVRKCLHNNDIGDFKESEKTEFEIKYMTFFWKHNPIAKYEKRLGANYVFSPSKCLDLINKSASYASHINGVYGLVKRSQIKQTKTGSNYFYLVVTDMKQDVKVRVFIGVEGGQIEEGKLYVFQGLSYNSNWGFSVSGREGRVQLLN